MSPWFRLVEAWAVQQLLRTPAFHRAVEGVARRVHRYQHGLPPDPPSGTSIDRPSESGFLQHFVDELKSQATGVESKSTAGVNIDARVMSSEKIAQRVREDAQEEKVCSDKAWQTIQDQAARPTPPSFAGAYMETLREQMRRSKPEK